MKDVQEFVIKDGVLMSYRGSSAEIVIPEGVHTIDSLAFFKDEKKRIRSIRFPESLEAIEDWAFSNCENLERIVIPSNVKEIGMGAFNWCRKLKEVVMEGTPKIAVGAFSGSPWEEEEFRKAGAKINGSVLVMVHPDLTEYTIPSNIKIIGRDAFKNCKVKEVDVPYGVTKLDICAFAYSALERISLPETLKIVDAYAFSNCTNLTELTIPRSVARIGDSAFEQLPNCVLTILNERDDEEVFNVAPDSFGRPAPCIKEVRAPYGSAAWRYAVKCGSNVTTLPCGPRKFGNPKKYHYVDEVFCCEGKTLHEYFGGQNVVSVPKGIRRIGANAFCDSAVERVCLPDSVMYIEELAFCGCEQLEEITGNGVEKIEEQAFWGCKRLIKAAFPRLKKYTDISFAGCDALEPENMLFPEDAAAVKIPRRTCACLGSKPIEGKNHAKATTIIEL